VEGSAPSETKEETTNNSLRALNVGALTILGTFARIDRKSRMIVINLNRLAPCEGTAWTAGLKGGAEGAIGE
jgi:hypothetical protein